MSIKFVALGVTLILILTGCKGQQGNQKSELLLEYKSEQRAIDTLEEQLKSAPAESQQKILSRTQDVRQNLQAQLGALQGSEAEKAKAEAELRTKADTEIAEIKRDAAENLKRIQENYPQFIENKRQRMEQLKKAMDAQ